MGLTDNLKFLYDSTNESLRREGRLWYPAANEYFSQLANKYGLQPSKVMGVVAALSPFVGWKTQLDRTEAFIRDETQQRGTGRFPGFSRNILNARLILHDLQPEQVLVGPKVRAFYQNLMGDTQILTLDRHAISAALGKKTLRVPLKLSQEITEGYWNAANTAREYPRDFQAIIWLQWRQQ